MRTRSIFDLDLFAKHYILTSTMITKVPHTSPYSVAAVPLAAMVCLLREEQLERQAALRLDPPRLRA